MRRPIQIQLLVPMLSVVVLAILLASGAGGYYSAMRQRQSQEDSLKRVVATLADGPHFPLTEEVLQQMSGLSGAEFVFLDTDQRVLARTLPLSANDEARLRDMAGSPSLELGGRVYICQRTPVIGRGPGTVSGSLVVLYSQERWSAATWQAAYPALAAGAIAVAVVVIVTTLLARRFVRPIHRLSDQTARIAQGDFTPVALGRVDDELPRPGGFDQSHDRAIGPVRARGAPQRAASHARTARRGHGPSTSQRGHRLADGDRAAPAAMRRGRERGAGTWRCGSFG